jgi:ribA/ribD-fused uncharacterized protein
MTIDQMYGEYRWLSNFHLCEVAYEGLLYPSTEHAYQSAKLPDVRMRAVFALPGTTLTCGQAMRLGRTQPERHRPDWLDVRVGVMYSVNLDKFTRHADLAERLVNTYPHELVEENGWGDQFWGRCNGVGENHLGLVLMDIRSRLRLILGLGV